MDRSERKLTKIARETQKLVVQSLRGSDMGSGEIELLHVVRHKPGIHQQEAADALGIDKAAITRRVGRMVEKGYLERRKDTRDGRSWCLFATDHAEEIKTSKQKIESTYYEWLLEELSEEEQTQFCAMLDRLYLRSKKESREGFPHFLKEAQEDA